MSQANGYRKRLVSGRGFDTEREYVHQEYPKFTFDVDGNRVRVESEDEEKAIIDAIVAKQEADDAAEEEAKKGKKKPADPAPTETLE